MPNVLVPSKTPRLLLIATEIAVAVRELLGTPLPDGKTPVATFVLFHGYGGSAVDVEARSSAAKERRL